MSQPGDEVIKLRSVDLAWQVVDGEIVVLDTRSSLYLALKGSGAVLWPHLAEGSTRRHLVSVLAQEYGIPADRADRDVEAFVGSLTRRGLLSA